MTAEPPSEPLLPFRLFDDEADVAVVQRNGEGPAVIDVKRFVVRPLR